MYNRRPRRWATSSRSRSYGARPGRSRLSRPVTRTQRWETAIINSELSMIMGESDFVQLSYTSIAGIALSLGNGAAAPELTIGTALASMNRALLIGGIVMDWGAYIISNYNNDHQTRAAAESFATLQLVTDRLSNEGGPNFPVSLQTYDPFAPMFPMSTLSTTTPTVDQNALPTRVHFRKYFPLLGAGRTISNPLSDLLYIPDDQKLNPSFGTINRRLRLRLDDEQGLFLVRSVQAGPSSSWEGAVIRWWMNGCLYYRFVQ